MIPDDDVCPIFQPMFRQLVSTKFAQTIRHASTKFLGWKFQQPGDGYLVSLLELLRIITRFSETVNPVFEHRHGLQQVCNYL